MTRTGTHLILAFIVGALIAATMTSLGRTPSVAAQQPAAQTKWEYKVVAFVPNDATGHEKKLNILAADGWEYVGVIHPGQEQAGALPLCTVAFQRPNR